jgi:hypothetical protein
MLRGMMIFINFLRQRFVLFLFLSIFLCPALFASQTTKLAGKATFPDKEYNEWRMTQFNPDLNAEEKIKSTVNTFFVIKYESWVKGILFDFDFLFDQSDAQAHEDYAYERGLMYLSLEAWKFQDSLLECYEYLPRFYEFKVDGQKATLIMIPEASIFFRTAPNMSVSGPWIDHMFSLELISGQWLIKKVSCDDERHEIYPHGTDFEKLAETIPERQKEFDAKVQKEYRERMQNDPKFMEIQDRRRLAKLLKSDRYLYPLTSYWRSFSGYELQWYAEYFTDNSGTYSTTSYNDQFLKWPGSDCQNYVSQCLWWGFQNFGLIRWKIILKIMIYL